MPAGHCDVIEEDVTVGVTPRADLVRGEQKSCTGVRAAKDHQQRRTVTQRIDGCLVLSRQGGIGLGVSIGQRLGRNPDAG